MNVSGIGSYQDTTTVSTLANQASGTDAATDKVVSEDNNGVIYDKSEKADKKTYKADKSIIDQLKADADARHAQLKSLVESMFKDQGKTYDDSLFWNMIREGDYTVSPEVAAKAKEDIAEDGYWGVTQTSERLASFAKALTGGDPSKVELMRNAIKEGFKAAEKQWGGKLPDISQKTYDATMKLLDDWANDDASA